MALVSSIYQLAPTDAYVSTQETERRLKVKIRRLVGQLGQAIVLARIRAWPASRDEEALKAWLVLTVYAEEGKVSGSF